MEGKRKVASLEHDKLQNQSSISALQQSIKEMSHEHVVAQYEAKKLVREHSMASDAAKAEAQLAIYDKNLEINKVQLNLNLQPYFLY
jgi:hypothetical protein